MINYAVIGTSFIAPKYIAAAKMTGKFRLISLLSRSQKTGASFLNRHDVQCDLYTDLKAMLSQDSLHAVYIASPNSLHCLQSIECLKYGKAVLVEKPVASNVHELQKMVTIAKDHNVLLMEAMKSSFLPNFTRLKENLHRIGQITGATAYFAKRSSRYDAYLAGENPNTFNPEFSNGSIMDLGTYCIYPFIALFGDPMAISGESSLLPSGVDGSGRINMDYTDFSVKIIHSKTEDLGNTIEIQGELGKLVIKNPSRFQSLHFENNSQKRITLSSTQEENDMFYMAEHFADLFKQGASESPINTFKQSQHVMNVIDQVRKETGIIFPADKL